MFFLDLPMGFLFAIDQWLVGKNDDLLALKWGKTFGVPGLLGLGVLLLNIQGTETREAPA
jgi:hypothetical protein